MSAVAASRPAKGRSPGASARVPAGAGAAAGVLGGLIADGLLGDPRRGHPVAGFGTVAARLERAVHRPDRTVGAVYALGLVAGVGALGVALDRAVGPRGRPAVLAGSLWVALGGRSLGRAGLRVAALVEADDFAGARRAVTALVSRDPEALDGPALCRGATESVAENTVDAMVAPLLWAAVAGPGGVLAHRAANTLDAMVGYRTERYERFGWAAARLDDLLNWPAARVGAALTVVLAPVVGGSLRATWRIWRRDGAQHPSPNGGQVEAAFAGALGVTLGGESVRAGQVDARPALGDGRAPGPADVRRAAQLSRAVGLGAALLAVAGRVALERRRAARRGGAARPANLRRRGFGGGARRRARLGARS